MLPPPEFAHLWLGTASGVQRAAQDAAEAVRLFETADGDHQRLGELNLARLDLSAAYLASGQADGMISQIRSVLDVYSARPTDSVKRRFQQVHAALSHKRYGRNSTAQILRDELGLVAGTGARSAVAG